MQLTQRIVTVWWLLFSNQYMMMQNIMQYFVSWLLINYPDVHRHDCLCHQLAILQCANSIWDKHVTTCNYNYSNTSKYVSELQVGSKRRLIQAHKCHLIFKLVHFVVANISNLLHSTIFCCRSKSLLSLNAHWAVHNKIKFSRLPKKKSNFAFSSVLAALLPSQLCVPVPLQDLRELPLESGTYLEIVHLEPHDVHHNGPTNTVKKIKTLHVMSNIERKNKMHTSL